eukprot:Pompholyxophrys_punicea_v1_NODE_1029_length_1029_cov_5.348049.p3 type:complete len:106 gc:universal NODE_1029_length_1029_cov_5.348049:764-447(-)
MQTYACLPEPFFHGFTMHYWINFHFEIHDEHTFIFSQGSNGFGDFSSLMLRSHNVSPKESEIFHTKNQILCTFFILGLHLFSELLNRMNKVQNRVAILAFQRVCS